MKRDDKSLSVPMQMFVKLGVRQINLIKNVVTAIKDTNTVHERLWPTKLNNLESTLIGLEEEASALEMFFEEPAGLLTDEQRKELEKNITQMGIIITQFSQMSKGEADERRKRIYTLLEHLERRIAEKKNVVNYNRTILISLTAILIAIVSITIAVIT